MLLSDFNSVCDDVERSNLNNRVDSSVRYLRNIIDDKELSDVGKFTVNNSRMGNTHLQTSSHARLDRIYASHEGEERGNCDALSRDVCLA